jgi:serine/threonine-protein kinase
MLGDLGLEVGKQEEWNATVPTGVVYAQSPLAGQEVLPCETVRLTISNGPQKVAVPDVVGMAEEVAKEAILQARLRNSSWVNYQGHDILPDDVLKRVSVGCVLSVTPAPGTLVDLGTVIYMAVRRD